MAKLRYPQQQVQVPQTPTTQTPAQGSWDTQIAGWDDWQGSIPPPQPPRNSPPPQGQTPLPVVDPQLPRDPYEYWQTKPGGPRPSINEVYDPITGQPGEQEENPTSGWDGGGWGVDTDWGNPANWSAYFQSRGLDDPGLVDQWIGYWNVWGKDNPEDFWARVSSSSNEILLGAPDPRYAGAGGGELDGGDGGNNGPLQDQLQLSMLKALQYGLNRDKFNVLWDQIMGNIDGLGGQHNANLETLIEGTNKSRNSQLKNIRAILADRGLLSEPGHTQGIEASAYTNLEDSLGEQYATGLRDLQGREFENQTGLFREAGDLLNQENTSQLGVLNSASGHSAQLGALTVQMLDQNRQWNQFLAQLGLDREKVMADIANGNITQWMSLIQAFIQTLGTAAQGQV